MRCKWDEIGERYYEAGADRGVVYPIQSDGLYTKGAPWNGLIGVNESPSGAEAKALWANNHKYLTLISAEEYGGTIKAYTYPDEFAECDGTAQPVKGVKLGQQKRKMFGFCYRTLLGNDTEKEKHGYVLHLVYGAQASPSDKEHNTLDDDPDAIEMSWEFSTTPVNVTGFDPVASMEIDSTTVDAEKLAALEDILYGKDPNTEDAADDTEPRLPLPDEVIELLKAA